MKYPDATPVDEPVAKPKQAASAPKPPAKAKTYPNSVPVDEPVKKMAKGGSVSSRADGCAQRGKTKGKMVTMKNGGI
jgi:hypothetical protein